MKRFVACFLLMAILLCACGQQQEPSVPTTEPVASHETSNMPEITKITFAYDAASDKTMIYVEVTNNYPAPVNHVSFSLEILDEKGNYVGSVSNDWWDANTNAILESGEQITIQTFDVEGIPYAVRPFSVGFNSKTGESFYYLVNSATAQIYDFPENLKPGKEIATQPVEEPDFYVYFPTGILEAGAYHSLRINFDRTVSAVGRSENKRCNVSGWEDIIKISAYSHSVGLKSNGRVVATGPDGYGQCKVSGWMDMVDVDAGFKNTIGACSDGTVLVAGDNEHGQADVSDWYDVVDVELGEKTSYGLKSNGKVLAAGSNSAGQADVGSWSDIVSISAGFNHVVGLKADGTVVATGSNFYGQCDVSGWKNIVAICAGDTHTVGLRADGTVVATGDNRKGQCDVAQWEDIVEISAGLYHTFGLTSSGKIVSVGNNAYGQCDLK